MVDVDEKKERFETWEHIQTAWEIGKDASGKQFTEAVAIDWETRLLIGNCQATFGEIICLAGDFRRSIAERRDDRVGSRTESLAALRAPRKWSRDGARVGDPMTADYRDLESAETPRWTWAVAAQPA